MGLYHSVAVTYDFELPGRPDLDRLDEVIGDGPDLVKDRVGHVIVGDYDRVLLVTRYTPINENAVVQITAGMASVAELAAWDSALHDVAVRLGHETHPEPAWLVVHNYR
jgi:hypothetical protein